MQHEQKLSYYISKSKSIDIDKFEKKIRIALLGSYTINGIAETFTVKCSDINIGCTTYVGGYNQYNQELLDANSTLYKFSPDISFLFLDNRSVLEDLYYFPYSISVSERQKFISNKIDQISDLIKSFTAKSKSKLVITNLSVPTYSPYGLYETKTIYGLQEMVHDYNSQLVKITKDNDSVYIYDFNGFVARFGEQNVFDFRQFFFGDIKVSFDYIPYLVHELMGYIKAILGLSKKCIVLDLDNTLWGGIIGEDGFEGIKLGNDPIGKAFVEFQKILLALHQRGIILAINSKNNADDALRVIKEHPNMILKEDHFACVKINWNDKIQNMKEIANELNIGLDSMVFFDDDPVNREYVHTNLPQVLTVEVTQDAAEYAQIIMSMNDFHLLKITEEDIRRGKMYIQDKQRKELESSATNLQEFLQQLGIKITIKKANDFTIPRISQLTLKTNQFNLTTRRYQVEDIRKLISDGHWVGCVQVEDKFGDNGITGVFIIKKESTEWMLDTFLLSCRIMGRGIEDGILGYILKKAKEEKIKTVKAEFIPTKKNIPCANFLSDYGFKKADGNYWLFDLRNPIKIPNHLKYVIE
ncbi:MAG: HAD-IIIC family phosphatase [Candidatus Nitrosotenuis sp.]